MLQDLSKLAGNIPYLKVEGFATSLSVTWYASMPTQIISEATHIKSVAVAWLACLASLDLTLLSHEILDGQVDFQDLKIDSSSSDSAGSSYSYYSYTEDE